MELPGFVIHIIHGKLILERMCKIFDEEQKDCFMMGILMADSNKGHKKDVSHFISADSRNSILKTPDLKLFVSKYRKYLSEPFVMGYLAHLYLDKVFFEKFFTEYILFQDSNGHETMNEQEIQKVYLSRQNRYVSVDELFSEEYLYGDYTHLNNALIAKYSLKIPCGVMCENHIEEVEPENFRYIQADLEKYFSLPSSENVELKIFCQSELENFISCQADSFVAYYENQTKRRVLS